MAKVLTLPDGRKMRIEIERPPAVDPEGPPREQLAEAPPVETPPTEPEVPTDG